ncbi:MAG: SAM-dependent methyltransferase [Acidobacteria bacterium]|nr:MAG: SAM-dependent methyltransferase [Acidobacteriota bacterium]REK08911.1 MAG: SAM-dependent methyltransferase [Acidobacteriota bacterium]
MLDYLRARRGELNDWLTREGLQHTFSLPTYLLHRRTHPLVAAHARSPCLDAGSGRSPWKPLLLDMGHRVVSIDVEDRSGDVDILTDVQDMPEVAESSMATVLCTQVLEHVPRPWQALREIHRVLRPGGHLVLSVPHLSVIHEAPHDYYRYTRYGLAALCEEAGLEVEEIEESGGLVCFLSHGFSMLFLCTFGVLPGMRRLAWGINLLFIRLLEPVDRLLGGASVYPCDYVVLARKPHTPATEDGSAA